MPTVTTNTAANSALRFLTINHSNTQSSISKLSSGSRIVKASDDAAGLAISTNLGADIVTLKQAAVNAGHGTAVAQVADGGLARISDILARMKSLAAQAMSGSVDSTSRGYIDSEYSQLLSEIDDIAEQTTFNGTSLLNASATISFMVGLQATDTIDLTTVDVTASGLSLNTSSVDTTANASTALTAIDTAIDTINSQRADMGAVMSRFDFHARNIDTQVENLEAAKSALMDVDVAAEMTKFTSAQVLMQANVAMLAQANQMPQNLLRLLQ